MQTESDVRQRFLEVLAEFGHTQNSLANGDKATQKRLNRQLGKDGASITVDTLLLILNKHNDVSAEWLLRGVGDMRTLPDGMNSPEDVEIGRLEKTVKRLTTLLGEKELRIRELEEMAMPQQKTAVG